MILFACDWCEAFKQPRDCWILGMGVEQVALIAARREIDILPAWDDARAVHPLAMHFCCESHKDQYLAAMFEPDAATAAIVVETEVRPVVRRAKAVRGVKTAAKTKKTARKSSKRRIA